MEPLHYPGIGGGLYAALSPVVVAMGAPTPLIFLLLSKVDPMSLFSNSSTVQIALHISSPCTMFTMYPTSSK